MWWNKEIPKTFLEEVYDILIEYAGARSHIMSIEGVDRDIEKEDFVRSHLDEKYPVTEWRFQGKLGFGGKFGVGNNKIRMYQEDYTPEREAVLELVNEKLAKLYEKYNQ